MERKLLLLLTCLFALTASAERINEQQALEKARQFMQGKVINAPQKARSVRRAQASAELQDLYIFNVEGNGGFVIVSGDDRTDAILGYSTTGRFDDQNIPENFRAWLQQTEAEIRSLPTSAVPADEGLMPSTRRAAIHAKINPLIITSWNQGNSDNDANTDGVYNIHLPKIGSKYPCTGCVAVVGAQLMYYYQWPQAMTQSVPGYSSSSAANTSADLSPIQFQWSKMKTSYVENDPNTEAVNAVADLLLYSAYAAKMDFGIDGSSGSTYTLAQGLCNYFDYQSTSWQEVDRYDYTASEWDALIYQELACGRPVIYSGSGSGAHAFICDGYDGAGMFHFNWGWGGSYDGYFKLQATNPYGSEKIGNSGFIANQSCVIGLQPSSWPAIEDPNADDTWDSAVNEGIVATASDVVVNGTTVTMSFWNNNTGIYGFNFGIGELNSNGSITPIQCYENYSSTDLGKGMGYSFSFNFSSYDLSDGSHILVPISQLRGETEWKRCKPSDLYFEVNVANGNMTIVAHPITALTVTNFDLVNSSNVGITQTILTTITNEGDHFDGELYLFLVTSGGSVGQVGYKRLKIASGNTKECRISVNLFQAGTYTLRLCSDWKGENVLAEKAVTIDQDLRATQFSYTGNLTAGRIQQVDVEVENHAGNYCLPLYLFASTTANKNYVYAAGSSIEGGSSDEVTFYFLPDQAGAWNLWVATDSQGENVIGQTTVQITEAQEANLKISSTVQNASAYVVRAENFTITVNVTNNGAYDYNDEIQVDLYKLIPGTNGGPWVATKTQDLQLASSASASLVFTFDDLEDGSSYFYYITYFSKGTGKWAATPSYQFVYTPKAIKVKTVQDKANARQFVAKYVNNGAFSVYVNAADAKVFSIYVDGDAGYYQACRTENGKYYINVGDHVIIRTDSEKEVEIHVDKTYTGPSSVGFDDIYDSKAGDDLAAVKAGAGVTDDLYLYRLTNTAGLGFGFTSFTGTTIKEGQFFIACSKKPEDAARLNMVWLDEDGNVMEDEATGIKAVESSDANNGVIYSLQGLRVDHPVKDGLYIQNGKKIVMKK